MLTSLKTWVQTVNCTQCTMMAMLAMSMRCPYISCMHNTLERNMNAWSIRDERDDRYSKELEKKITPSKKATHTSQIPMHFEIFVSQNIIFDEIKVGDCQVILMI